MGFGAVVTSRCAGTKGWVPRKMPELWQLLSGWGPYREGSVHQAERLQGRGPWDWGRRGAAGGAPSSRVGTASGRKPLPSGKGQLPVAPTQLGGVLGAEHCPPCGVGAWGWG